MSLADIALAFGRELADLDGDPGPPRPITLRKAVHCAYYAAFGALCEEWANMFAPSARATASRMLQHSTIKEACISIAGTGTLRGGAACPTDLRRCARLIPQLQDRRHDADYDSSATFTRDQTHLLLEQAGQVMEWLRAARTTCTPELHLFLLQCAGARR